MQEKNKPIRIFFAGDFCSTSSTKPITVSEELKGKMAECDLKVCNFEVPLKPDNTEVKPGWYFYQNDDSPAFLEKLGFNLFSFANNHAFDYGIEGWQKTMDAFRNRPFGSGLYEDAYKVKIVEKNGIKIGFLALCYAARFGVFDNLTNKEGYSCAWINDLKVNHVIIEAKKQVDFLVILPHDGIEYIDIPLPETIARYRDFIDYGADTVIGTHPHCPQGWETYKGRPIFYSLGNFLFNSKTDYTYRAWNRPHWYEGLCVILNICQDSISFETINTLNDGNIAISIDHDSKRDEHNKRLCGYLEDPGQYLELLEKECRRLAQTQELPIIDQTFHKLTLRKTLIKMVRFVYISLLKKQQPKDTMLQSLLKNDSRRSVLLRGMNATPKIFYK